MAKLALRRGGRSSPRGGAYESGSKSNDYVRSA